MAQKIDEQNRWNIIRHNYSYKDYYCDINRVKIELKTGEVENANAQKKQVKDNKKEKKKIDVIKKILSYETAGNIQMINRI